MIHSAYHISVLSFRQFTYTSCVFIQVGRPTIVILQVLDALYRSEEERKNYTKKKLQTDPTDDTNGYGEKRGKPPFLYCNRSVEKRVCVWSSGNGGKWKPSNRNKDVNEGRDNDKPIR